MSERRASAEPIRSHAHAEAKLEDAPYLAYIFVQLCKLGMALVVKRWPEIR